LTAAVEGKEKMGEEKGQKILNDFWRHFLCETEFLQVLEQEESDERRPTLSNCPNAGTSRAALPYSRYLDMQSIFPFTGEKKTGLSE
jgi:hypothetical protein